MTVAVRTSTPAERAALASQGFKLSEHATTYLLDSIEGAGAVAVVADRAFETQLLGLPTRHVDEIRGLPPGSELPAPLVGALLNALEAEGARLVTCRRPESDRSTLAALQAGGFRVVECLLTLARSLNHGILSKPIGVALASAADADGCGAIGAAAFRYDRFHADCAIDERRASALKSAWARNSVLGRADAVFVTRSGGSVTGFNACLLRGDTAIIDLIGVAPQQQGKGLGRALVAAALAHYSGRARRMLVGTQSCNFGSLALYQGLGFRVESSALSLHAHLWHRSP